MNPNPTDPNKPNPTTAPTDSLTPPPPAPKESGMAGGPVSTFTPLADLSSAISNPIPAAPAADTNSTPSPIPNPWDNTVISPPANPLPTNPVQSEPTPIPNLTEPVSQSATSTDPQPWAPPTSQSEPTWTPPPVADLTTQPTPAPQPMPTFTPPVEEPNSPPTTQPPQIPTPTESDPIQPMPTFTPPAQPEIPQPNSQDFMSNMPASGQTELNTNPAADTQQLLTPTAADPAPTDLSHLIPTQNGEQTPVYTPPITQPETLVVPPDGNGTVAPNIPTETKAGFPKWVIGAAVALLLIVSAASAYFILGIGQPQNTSVPATQQVQQKPIITPPAIITSTPPAATGSATGAGFGQFQAPTPPPATGSSAADILRQRLGR